MKVQVKIALLVGFIALMTSCQKEEMPSPTGCDSHQADGANMRISNPENGGDDNTLNNDDSVGTADSVIVSGGDDDRDGGGIVGGGDGDRDGGGITSGGDDDHDGGNRMLDPGTRPR